MENEQLIRTWKSEEEEEEDSMVSATVGRVMNTLLTARPTKLLDSITHLQSFPNPPNPLALSLENSLRILHKYVRDGAEKDESLDEVLVPMIEHSLRSKESKYKDQEIILLNWLFQDEVLFQALAKNFSVILLRKEDHHVALGWCILARRLIEYDVTMSEFSTIGLKERYNELLANLCTCSTHLLSLINKGSTLQGGFELPTRLSMAAADCVIALSVALTRTDVVSDTLQNNKKSSKLVRQDRQALSVAAVGGTKKVKPIGPASEPTRDMRELLWHLLDQLIMLVHRLLAWSRKSRSLHAKGLERVLKWLNETNKQYRSSEDPEDPHMVKTGMLLLSSCWKHYGILVHLEDRRISRRHKELLDQYLSGIEFYAENHSEKQIDNGAATLNFFMNCLLLLLGRFSTKQFDNAMAERRLHISRVVTSRLCSADVDVIDGALSILKAVVFGTNHSVSRCTDSKQMNSVLPLLLSLLDERDGTARAVVTLIAEYCSVSADGGCLEEILKRLASGNVTQRRNSMDVVAELVRILSDSGSTLSHLVWHDIANQLLECLDDEDSMIRADAARFMTLVDPSLVLPSLVRRIYLSDETTHSSAGKTLLGVLSYHNRKPEVLCMLLDCLSNLNESGRQKPAAATGLEGVMGDADEVLKLIPKWSKSVTNWKPLIGPLIDKMFAEPSNAIIVKFLSYISDHLAGVADVVFRRILLHTESQNEFGESFLCEPDGSSTDDDVKLKRLLFDRLCPLLIIRLLPLRVFNDLKSSLVYGNLPDRNNDRRGFRDADCVASLLLKRAFNGLEFEDVRKLSAELCGRIHPDVLFPAVSSELEYATNDRDILKIKACLFFICTSLVVRGRESVTHPDLPKVREAIETVLLWPSADGDEISKAQHGCIDCLAIMVCAEIQDPEHSGDSNSEESPKKRSGNAAAGFSTHAYVVDRLTCDGNEPTSSDRVPSTRSLPFRLCMANVLISVCRKILDSGRKPFASRTLRRITRFVGIAKEPEIRAACIQVLFSVVYHLKIVVLPYASDLLKVSLESLKRGNETERMAGAKLLASLMASEDAIVRSISDGLVEARALLSTVSQTDSSSTVRQLCAKLLLCMTSP